MLNEANEGFLFCTTEKIAAENPNLPVFHEYEDLRNALEQITKSDNN